MRFTAIIFLFLFFCCANIATAQDTATVTKMSDSTFLSQEENSTADGDSVTVIESGIQVKADSVVKTDTTLLKKKKFQPEAKRAGLFSALVPGFGQLYNRQYWKMPIVYSAMGTTMYFALKSNGDYRKYRKAYVSRLADGENSKDQYQGILSTQGIKQYQDDAQQNRDLMIVLTVVAYAGQILEAISGAHLKNFDISKDLTMQISPVITPVNTIGIGLVMNFKK